MHRSLSQLPSNLIEILETARRAVLTTLGPDGTPNSVPICFALLAGEIVTAIDHKPKSDARPARIRNIERDPRAAVLFDRWDEDWSRLAWVLVRGRARIEPPGSADDVLRARYPQYELHPPAGEVIVVTGERVTSWSWARAPRGAT